LFFSFFGRFAAVQFKASGEEGRQRPDDLLPADH
jgi:hypothetical protein